MQTEQEKYGRRLNGFHERMNAKDEEYAKLEETYLRETKSAPPSPITSSFINVRRFSDKQPNIISQEQYDHDINELKQKIKDLVLSHQEEISKLQQEKERELDELGNKLRNENKAQLERVGNILKSEHKGRNEEFIGLISSLESEKKSYIEKLGHFEALKKQLDLDRAREYNMHQEVIQDLKANIEELKKKHTSKIIQMNEKFNSNEARLKSLFINENQQINMHCEARIENLVAEHQNTLQELRDSFDNEKEVIQIKHQTAFDEKCRTFEAEKLDWMKKNGILTNDNKVLIQVANQSKEQKEKISAEFAKFKKDSAIKSKELLNVSCLVFVYLTSFILHNVIM